jgi:cephalosporin hydroxylase
MERTIWKNPLGRWVYKKFLHYTKPDVNVELGIAHEGGTLYLANLLEFLPNSSAQVIGINSHPSCATDPRHPRIKPTGGICLDPATVGQVTDLRKGRRTYE